MVARCLLLLCWLLVLPIAQAQDWSDFEWVRASKGNKTSEKGALYLPVKISGATGTYYMQLDTGAPRTMLYGIPFKQILPKQNETNAELADDKPSNQYSSVSLTGAIGGLQLSDVPVLLYNGYGGTISSKDKYPLIGTIGLDMFKEHAFILDFPKRRFALLNKGESIPSTLAARADFFDVSLRSGLLFLPVSYDGEQIDSVLYDTGSSIFPLLTTRNLWQRMTGRTGNEQDNERVTISSWGKQVVMTGAKMTKALRVGSMSVAGAMVYFAPPDAENLSFEKWPFKVNGLVGNALFYEDKILIIDLPHKQMAILQAK